MNAVVDNFTSDAPPVRHSSKFFLQFYCFAQATEEDEASDQLSKSVQSVLHPLGLNSPCQMRPPRLVKMVLFGKPVLFSCFQYHKSMVVPSGILVRRGRVASAFLYLQIWS
eukprot:scaffold74170_cov35-Prasinocladus_malaysianus.AAC.1